MSNLDFSYKYAIVCKSIPSSIKNGLGLTNPERFNIENAIDEQNIYINKLKNMGLQLIEVESNEKYPDCVFVEDTAIAIHNKIFIANPGAISRRGETIAVKNAVEKFANEHSSQCIEIGSVENADEAFIDGGDCCYTGRELLVGISKRTNLKGAKELAAFFTDTPITPVNVNILHLKSAMSMIDFDTFIIGNSIDAQLIRKEIESKSKFGNIYKFVVVEDDRAGNVIFLNGNIFYPEQFKDYFESMELLKNKEKYGLPNLEFEKINGSVSCRSVLF
jgi:dimethylargininase